MKIDIVDYSIYGNSVDALSNDLILACACKKGLRAALIKLEKKGAFPQCSSFAWLRFDLRNPYDLQRIMDYAVFLESGKCLVFPPSSAIETAEDKWKTFLALRAASVPTIDTFSLENLTELKGPVVLKPRVGWGGRGISLIINPERSGFSPSPVDKNLFICQPYIKHDRIWTVAVAGGMVTAVLRTDNLGNDFRSNCTCGSTPKIIACPPGMASSAIGALDCLGLAAGTVDMIEHERKYLVLEINSAPRLSYVPSLSVDLAGPMFNAVLSWFRSLH